MDDNTFWRIIGLLDWNKTGDDDAVLKPAANALAKQTVEDIAAFEETLSQKLYTLDTKAHARQIGEGAYVDEDQPFSVDWFLYARCCVVANGRQHYDAVLADPSQFPRNMEFEALLELAATAHEMKTGAAPEFFETTVSYETFSNRAGWQDA